MLLSHSHFFSTIRTCHNLFLHNLSALFHCISQLLFKSFCRDQCDSFQITKNHQARSFAQPIIFSGFLWNDNLSPTSHFYRSPQKFSFWWRCYFCISDFLIIMHQGIDLDAVKFCQFIAFFNIRNRISLLPFCVRLSRNTNNHLE